MTKDDQSFLKTIIRDTILEMKEDILASVTLKIDKMEGEIHEMALEKETLKQEIKNLKTVDQKDENTTKLNKQLQHNLKLRKQK